MRKDPAETVMGHVYVAFGQGTGVLRVSRAAVQAFHAHYRPVVTGEVIAGWDTLAVQVLERIRAVGRLAALAAAEQGKTAIGLEEALRSARAVEMESGTPLCPPQSAGTPIEGAPALEVGLLLLGQACIAFGQGTGTLRVTREAVAALRERYDAMVTEDLVERWDTVAVQVLERVRATGRLAAHLATGAARTAILAEDVKRAAVAVEEESGTEFCPPRVTLHAPALREDLVPVLTAS
jgi:hypothetical protein